MDEKKMEITNLIFLLKNNTNITMISFEELSNHTIEISMDFVLICNRSSSCRLLT